MTIKENYHHLITVFQNWRYSILLLIIAFSFYAFNALLLNYRIVFSALKTKGLGVFSLYWSLIIGYKNTIAFHSFFTLVIISVLFGILFSLILYKTLRFSEKKHPGFLGGLGIFLGVLAPGCAACGIGVFSLFGFGAAFITFLPFNGLELSLLAIAILTYAILRFAADLNTCKL